MTGDSSYGMIAIPYTRNGFTTDTDSDLDGITACASDTWNPTTLSFDLDNSNSPNCWPWSSQSVAIIRKAYTSTATDTSSCARGLDTLQYVYWLFTNAQVNSLVEPVNMLSFSSLTPAIQAAYIAALDAVTCDGHTLLITLPTIWQLNSGISAFASVMCGLGIVLCLIVATTVIHSRHHPVMRSASPPFLFMSVTGVLVLFVSGFMLVSTASSGICSAVSWSIMVGLQLTFAPLFAKTWRIYRIFGRKKLSVVTISNKKLMLLVLAILALDAILIAIWQGMGPLEPIITTINTTNSGGSLVINQYTQCGVEAGNATTLFTVICIEKGVLFVFGALMAFTTRRVSSTFNESQGISLSIYNVCFTIGIITPIILVISAVGDVLTLLLVFALLWIAYFTGGILFVPKLMTIYYHHDGVDGSVASITASSGNSSSGYQFLSLAALSTAPVLQGYLTALQKHVTQVEAKLTAIRKTASGGGNSSLNTSVLKSAATTMIVKASPTESPINSRNAAASIPSESPISYARTTGMREQSILRHTPTGIIGASSRATARDDGAGSGGVGDGVSSPSQSPPKTKTWPTRLSLAANTSSSSQEDTGMREPTHPNELNGDD